MKRNKKPGAWIALGIGVGTALGVALENIAVGIALGTTIGVGIFYVNTGRRSSED